MRRYHWLPVTAWSVVLLLLCGLPGKDIPRISWLEALSFDKLVHVGMFTFETVFFIGWLRKVSNIFIVKNAILISVLVSVGYGILLEIAQTTVFIGRSGDVVDVIADGLGALFSIYLIRMKIGKKLLNFI